MAFELQILGWSGLLAVAQLLALTVAANIQVETRLLAGPRDEAFRLPPLSGRLKRAFDNHLEGLAMFSPAVLVVVLGDGSTAFTTGCATVYLVARLVYVPVYAMGIPYLRSAVWVVGFAATVAMLVRGLL